MPFLRLLAALATGILLQYFFQAPVFITSLLALGAGSVLLFCRFLSVPNKFRFRGLEGIAVLTLVMSAGMLIFFLNQLPNRANWFGNHYRQGDTLVITLQEPLVEKKRSYKALASVNFIRKQGQGEWNKVMGYLWVYVAKGPSSQGLQYGSQLLLYKPLQPITNYEGAGFDYRQYCANQGIYHQVFLNQNDFLLFSNNIAHPFRQGLFNIRDFVIATLHTHIEGSREAAVATALLIGYRNDLDKELLQSYSNTGVVHIIAISGMHLGMIYGLLVFLFKPLRRTTGIGRMVPLLILLTLWAFSILAGAGASILRSAVMFSFIVIGDVIGKRNHSLNSLAASAFCLLVYDPFFLWDIGFQLSYAAVLGILLFQQPLYKTVYCEKKLLDYIWQLNTLSLSAQVFTFPLLLYHFHQFPSLFLFSNFFAVPLSGLILYGCLLLVTIAPVVPLGSFSGAILSWLIRQLNGLITRTDQIPYSAIQGLQISFWQMVTLYGCIAAIAWWLMQKQSKGLLWAIVSMVLFLFMPLLDLVL